MEASIAAKKEFESCECGEQVCNQCGQHSARGMLACLGCMVEDEAARGFISEEAREAIQAIVNKAEVDRSACPECSGGASCSVICDECQMSQAQDELRHEMSHGPGRG